jgi:hypothetical protein
MPLPGGQVATMAAGNTRDAAGLWSTDADMDDAAPSHIELRKVTCRLERCFRESQKRVDRDGSEIRFLALTLSIPDDRTLDRTPLRPPGHRHRRALAKARRERVERARPTEVSILSGRFM